MTQRIRTALVGCGKVGHTHAQALKAFPQSDFVAVCSRSREKVDHFARQYEVQGYTNFEQMLTEVKVQMVAICTPHPVHADQIIEAARHGVHSLVEKPLASDLNHCDRAIVACRQGGVKLGVISQRRFYKPVVRLQQAIEAGKIGRPVLATLAVLGWRDEAYYQSDPWRGKWDTEGGGVLVNQTPHQLDVFQWLMGPIDELFGYWDNLNHPYLEVEDTAVAVVRFKSGALGQILVSNSQKPGFYGKIHIHGSNGASVGAQTEGGSPFIAGVTTTIEPPLNDIWTVPGEEHLLPVWQEEDRQTAAEIDVMTYYHRCQIKNFLQAIIENQEPLVNGEEGRKVVEMFTAVYRSQRDGRPIKFPLAPETGRDDYDGRLTYLPLSRRDA
ncbi:MAG: Gfo/Idh/MocA family oxidoreductase [Anaerolineae bacterium]|nr:Gfo/Idh/MocA family oxidoreductase [Anaerolineae bacterium]